MKRNNLNKNELILLKQTEDYIYKMYQQYHNFMQYEEELPRFKINYRKATENVFANVRYINDGYVLSVDPIICKIPFVVPTLHHEFTHIYDDIIMASLHEEINRNTSYIYHAYTEYHASQIEMMAKMGASVQYGVISEDVEQNKLLESLLREKKDSADKSKRLDLSKRDNFSSSLDWFCYYIGKVNAYLLYYKEGKDELLNLTEFSNIFGKEIILLQKALFDCDTRDIKIEYIFKVADIHKMILRNFTFQK